MRNPTLVWAKTTQWVSCLHKVTLWDTMALVTPIQLLNWKRLTMVVRLFNTAKLDLASALNSKMLVPFDNCPVLPAACGTS